MRKQSLNQELLYLKTQSDIITLFMTLQFHNLNTVTTFDSASETKKQLIFQQTILLQDSIYGCLQQSFS